MRLELEKPFRKKSKKLLLKNPALKATYEERLSKLSIDPFASTLHTHLLTGELKGKYVFSLTHDLRIVFKLQADIVHLLDIGNHDEVY